MRHGSMGALAAFMLGTRQVTGALCRFNLTYGAQVHPKCRKCSIWLGTINACILAATGSSRERLAKSAPRKHVSLAFVAAVRLTTC